MAENTNIIMGGQTADFATPVRQAQADANANAQSAEQVLKQHLDNMGERDKRRIQSTVVGAAQLKTYLDKQDYDGAHDFLLKRQSALHQRMGNGEDVDDQETAYALDKLRRGDIQGLQNDVSALTAAGQAYGMIGGVDGTPSSVREWQYYNSLSPEDQKRWRDQKRAGSNVDLGDKVIRLDAGGAPEQTFTKELAPADQPDNARDKAAASAEGAKVGEEMGTAKSKLAAMQAQQPRLIEVVDKLSALGKKATYTVAGKMVDSTARQLGANVPEGAVALTEYLATVDNEVLPLLRQTFGSQFTLKEGEDLRKTLGDPSKSPVEKDAVLKAFIEQKIGEIESLQRQTAPQGATPSAGGMVRISNGTETYMVTPEDAAEAAKEGFKQIQ